MDYSTKVSIKSGSDQGHESEAQADAASSPTRSVSVELPESALPCNTCPSPLVQAAKELTNRILNHSLPRNTDGSGRYSPRSTDGSGEDEYCCCICNKVLSSASSLDRHALVHTGERPYTCTNCSKGFTTNGNMNRHVRTLHRGSRSPHSYTDSEAGSSDSERPANSRHLEEYNNNEITKRNSPNFDSQDTRSPTSYNKRKYEYPSEESSKRQKILLNNSRTESVPDDYQNVYNCPVCGRQDFASCALLESHLERDHPEYQAKCETCNVEFRNHRVFHLHRFMTHFDEIPSHERNARNLRNSRVGFEDLTFVDFSAEKFAAIARAICEQSVHRPASGEATRFQCSKCLRAFPCRSALDAHETDCGTTNLQTKATDDSQSRRDDFFAGLDLQNKAALTEAKEGKDLADIQSIISVTSGPILQNFPRSDASTPENNIKFNLSVSSSGSSGNFSSDYNEEEAQDAFAAEFRKMKSKGEFPCRLCEIKFPNLRALKGHNRAHTNVAPGMPYPCNMCPYTSTDKATLTRHLRQHNGDRPYECSLCKFAFTTKANCERHVRNRHGKLTREEIKKVIIYHPSEDPTNENAGRTSPRAIKDDVRKSLVYPAEHENLQHQAQVHYPPVPLEMRGEIRVIEEAKLLNSVVSMQNHNNAFPRPLELNQRTIDEARQDSRSDYSKLDDDLSSSSEGSVSLVSDTKSDTHQRIQASPINLKKRALVSENVGDDVPLDLSMDVLDLSKKSKVKEENNFFPSHEQIEKKDFFATNNMLLTDAFLKASQGAAHPSLDVLYASANAIYRNLGTFPANVTAGILPPYMFNPHVFGQDFSMKESLQKELVRGLQLTSGGTLVEPTISAAGFTPFQGSVQSPKEQNTYAKLASSKMSPRHKSDNLPSSNSVKMVIKNGVLMPKQKQRRYRTERPFSCGYCSARFTLRSNMERHIKQQHPQYWCQRPRGGQSTRGRPPASHPTLLHNGRKSASQVTQLYTNILPKVQQSTNAEFPKRPISNQVKYAILAQQLKGNKVDEIDSEEELVIDEDRQEKDGQESQAQKEKSLLRGQLEATDSVNESVAKEDAKSTKDISEENNSEESVEKAVDEETKESDTEMAEIETEKSSEKDSSDKSRALKSDTESKNEKIEDGATDLASVSELLDNASQQYQQFQPQYLSDEEGLVAPNSDNSGSDDKSDSVNSLQSVNDTSRKKKKKKKGKKKSAYSMAPNRVICPYCDRPFPWSSSLRRHVLTHTGQKPYQCVHCSLLFTTKSNCDRHLLRKHKANPNKVRRVRNSSSPDAQAVVNNNNNSFSMRNVPERPYKCNQCPSSTFSTLGNLKKHRSTKHGRKNKSRSNTPPSVPQNSPQECSKDNEQTDYDSQSSSASEGLETSSVTGVLKSNLNTSPTTANDASRSRRSPRSPRSSPGPSDVPFKCHLCDSGFAERQDCLDHLKNNHKDAYEKLVAKGALDMDTEAVEDQQQAQQHTSDGEEKRGRFPDYSNRKVVCAFCMRRFWSAEDLRRHMRTHTGERPFACDICKRRFTLKHSMLRHRKKHESVDSTMYVGDSGDEDNSPSQPPTITPRSQQQPPILLANSGKPRIQDRISLPTVAPVMATGDAAPSGLMRFNPYENLTTLTGTLASIPQNVNPEANPDGSEENDLISNLLGIRDRNFIDRVLQASADDAAKLLGVKRSHE